MDSIEITVLRTGAATAVAAKYLARGNSEVMTICGCGNQGKASLKAVMCVRPLKKIFAFDSDEQKAREFAEQLSGESNLVIYPTTDLKTAVQQSDICITCTPSKKPFLFNEYISPGTFIAAVGADSEDKQELEPSILFSHKVVTDISAQYVLIGELHHAVKLKKDFHAYAELGQIIAGEIEGRTSDEEIIVFDSTGTALQDIVSAAIVYEKAVIRNEGMKISFAT